ncbi:ATP-binding cassette domain-containing protein [Pusillimonas noertemannii]|uniref:ATP-binding cassette domain-containing protein n=1 Tax=Pusillimonas noertemannii TaxID=305977 RepID=UPI00035C2CA7|nr:sugar ABC transporter ATP-binding protein [Pusillimonas noertemannii]
MPGPVPPPGVEPVLEVRQVEKRFGHTLALQDVSLDVLRGEVHALLGHNGSGKSTTVKIISGVYSPDKGSVSINGLEGRPAQIGVVHQDLGLCFDATVLENCCMAGYQTGACARIDWTAERRVVEPILESLDAGFASFMMVRDLSPANQAIVAIARALKRAASHGALDLLVLDEATARLRGRDADKVLATARLVARQGGGVLIVTHHMSEVLRAAHRATVLMNGRVAGIVNVAETTEEQLLELASGRQVTASRRPGGTSPAGHARRKAVLTVNGMRGDRFHSDRQITIAAGEIVGLTGAPGAGHEEVPYLIAGVVQGGSAGVSVLGRATSQGAHERRRRGVGLVPAERLSQGILLQATVRENLSPLVRARHTWARLLSKRRELAWAEQVCSTFQIIASGPDAPISTLSGGNQQKVLLARVLEDSPKVLLLHEPTEGVDEMTRRDLVALIRKVAERGTAVFYVSSDIDEVAGCADRVLVVREGDIVAEFPSGPDMADAIYAACYLAHEGGLARDSGLH